MKRLREIFVPRCLLFRQEATDASVNVGKQENI